MVESELSQALNNPCVQCITISGTGEWRALVDKVVPTLSHVLISPHQITCGGPRIASQTFKLFEPSTTAVLLDDPSEKDLYLEVAQAQSKGLTCYFTYGVEWYIFPKLPHLIMYEYKPCSLKVSSVPVALVHWIVTYSGDSEPKPMFRFDTMEKANTFVRRQQLLQLLDSDIKKVTQTLHRKFRFTLKKAPKNMSYLVLNGYFDTMLDTLLFRVSKQAFDIICHVVSDF